MMTIAEAVLRLDGYTRESLAYLRVWNAEKPWRLQAVPAQGQSFACKITPDSGVTLDAQVQQLTRTGLVGEVRLLETPDDDGASRLLLWSGPGQREAWQHRIDLASARSDARDLLAAAGDFKAANHRRESARSALVDSLRSAATAAGRRAPLSHSDQVRLAQVARETVYAAVNGATPAKTPTVTNAALERMPMGHNAPCVICHTPAVHTYDGQPIHPAECLRQLAGAWKPLLGEEPPAPAPAQARAPRPARATAGVGLPEPTRSPRKTTRTPAAKAKRRFDAPAAAVDAENVYLPGGITHPLPALHHLGQLAALVEKYSLGHGGGAAMPDAGEVWIYPDVMEMLGLPLEGVGETASSYDANRELLASLLELPAVTEALADGWTLGQGGQLGARTYMRHTKRKTRVNLVFVAWTNTLLADMLNEAEDGETFVAAQDVLVDRLAEFAELVGVTYRITPGVTGEALINNTRPLRAADAEWNPNPIALRDTPAELPPFLRDSETDHRFSQIERDFSWYRNWASLTEDERAHTYVHAYDHHAHYLQPWINTHLGVEGLIHLYDDDARWRLNDEKAAYYLIDRWDEWPDWRLPDPLSAAGAYVEDNRVWVTAHTLKQAEKILPGFTENLTFHEAYTWERQTPYLNLAGRRLLDARAKASPEVAATVKKVYAAVTSKIASTEKSTDRPLFRPDWRDQIIGASRSAVVSAVLAATPQSYPLVLTRDTIIWASDEADPVAAWPGKSDKLTAPSGGWRPIGSARLDNWGPSALAKSAVPGFDYKRWITHGLAEPGRA